MGQRMENFIYRVVTMTIAVLVCLVSSSCAKKVTSPDLSNVAIEDARNVLTNAGLIPSVEYEYSNDYAEGIVIKTDPTIGEQVELQTKVNLIVSKGPEYVDAKNSSVSWYVTDSSEDEWKNFIAGSKVGMQNYHHILRGLKTLTDENGEFVGFDRSNDQSDKYAVHYLPTKYLIAADGTIIGKIGTDEELDSILAEIFAE